MPFLTSRSCTLLMALALLPLGWEAAEASELSPPPTNSGNGARPHGTGAFENLNIPFSGAQDITPSSACDWSTLSLHKGVFRGMRQDMSGCMPTKEDLVGVRFFAPFGGQTVELTLQEVAVHTNVLDGTISSEVPFRFRVGWRLGQQSGQLCSTTNGFALAVPYAWTNTGEPMLPTYSTHFTFACIPDPGDNSTYGGILEKGGVIAKCIDWGYPPWSVNKTVIIKGEEKPYAGQDALDFHQTCVRMAMADYCSEGAPNTLDGSPMAFADMKGVLSFSPSPLLTQGGTLHPEPSQKGYYLEAVWGFRDDYRGVTPLCLGKRRWETLSLRGACLNSIGPIKKTYDAIGVTHITRPLDLSICENWDINRLKASEALLFSYSPFLDKALVRFRQSSSYPLFLTTSSVVLVNPGPSHLGYRPNLDERDGVPDPSNFGIYQEGGLEQNKVEGSIFSKNIPSSLLWQLKLKPLYQCTLGPSSFILTDDNHCELPLDQSPLSVRVEGFIYAPDDPVVDEERIPLYLWWNENKSAYVTSTEQPPQFYAPERRRLLGYLPPLRVLADLALQANP
ncbi:hypothetical protein JQX13_43595 [Archangium violaceum]|uniref:ADYC domain-containing protein n=1 Tax=Archangium violaceum TaxID=83451 RepID=UPI00193C65E0|nr:ADYC domain-containing protein [Archangium violaceum]QRK06878.1 hypothetical protein JQX13_43595 [Archangium violaceum]